MRFDETNGSQREHLPSVIDEPAPEESIKFKATKDVIPTEESAEEFIPEREERRANAPKKMLKKMLSLLNIVNPLIPASQMKCRLRESSTTSKHQVLSHAQRLHICLTFVGTLLLSLSQSPPEYMRNFWSLSGSRPCKKNYISSSSIMSRNWSNVQILASIISAQSGSTATRKMKMALW